MTNNIIHFSGGKDSTAMLLKMVEKDIPIHKVLFFDFGKEFPEVYNNIEKVIKFTGLSEKFEIVKDKFGFDYWFFDYKRKKGKYINRTGYGFPDFRTRWCTNIKINSLNKKIKDIPNTVNYIGIAVDELKRIVKVKDIQEKRVNKYPLIEWNVTEKDCLNYCYNLGFDWGGLYDKFNRLGCWCCALKSLPELKILYNYYPVLWEELKKNAGGKLEKDQRQIFCF